MMAFLIRPALLAGLLLALSAARAESFRFAAIGDVPYGSVEELTRLVDAINLQPTAFTIHVGDIKSGATVCEDGRFEAVRAQFDRVAQALIYTPGDNEWTDCHRFSNGSYDPLERLEKIRQVFFHSPNSLGKRPIAMQAQSAQAPFARYVENRRWVRGRVSFATVHIVGSNNNLPADDTPSGEFAARNQANIAWMQETFAQARAREDAAVVLAMQADTFIGSAPSRSGFQSWLSAFAREAKAWGKPVLLIQGDSHALRIDQPVTDDAGKPLLHVTRLVVAGAPMANAMLIDVDMNDLSQPFRFAPMAASPR
jgi:hypothetical protein